MKTFFLLILFGFSLVFSLPAQAPAPATVPKLTVEELDELLAPVALYPDPLISLILPAAVLPSEIVLEARYLNANGDPAQIDNQPWDDSVKALGHYPDIVKWMDQNLEWTTQVGVAFLNQPDDVMDSIQQLRAEAKAAGNLTDTPQQNVVVDDGAIRIVPADPDVIYAPRYDPEVVYQEQPTGIGTLFSFSDGWPVGRWLNYDLDWHRHRLYAGEWHRGWDYRRHRVNSVRADFAHINHNLLAPRLWQPDPNRLRMQPPHRFPSGVPRGNSLASIPRPNVVPGSPTPPGIVRGPHPGGNFPSAPPNFTRPGTGPRVITPNVPSPTPRPPVVIPGGPFGGGDRGSIIRGNSQRGQISRHSNEGPVNPPAPPMVIHPPTPIPTPAPQPPRFTPQPRPPQPQPQPQPPPPPAFRGINVGPGANDHSVRGANSRNSRP